MAESAFDILERIFDKCIKAQSNPNLSQQTKDKLVQEIGKALNFVLEETSPQKINQLIYAELKKRSVDKLNG